MATRLRRTEQVERNREVVLAAARRVFLDKGYAGASLEAIAGEAGFSKGVVYSQFGSKPDLFLALLERRIDERAEHNVRIAGRMTGGDGVRELLRAGGRDAVVESGWARLLVEFRALAGHDHDLNRRYAEAHARSVDQLASVLGDLHERGGLQPIVSLHAMAELLMAIHSGLTLERAANPAALSDEDLEAMLPRALGLPDHRQGDS